MGSRRAEDLAGEREWRAESSDIAKPFFSSSNNLRNKLIIYLESARRNPSKIIKKGLFRTIYLNDFEAESVARGISNLFKEERLNPQKASLLRSLHFSVRRNKTKLTQIIEILRSLK